jgi:uncharacterized membrane-anchored protein YitT (DUF2179 family)
MMLPVIDMPPGVAIGGIVGVIASIIAMRMVKPPKPTTSDKVKLALIGGTFTGIGMAAGYRIQRRMGQ